MYIPVPTSPGYICFLSVVVLIIANFYRFDEMFLYSITVILAADLFRCTSVRPNRSVLYSKHKYNYH